MANWVVHKFGGTSVANAECFRQVRDIVFGLTSEHRVACVVSAMGGKPKVTDMLLNSVKCAAEVDEAGYRNWLTKLKQKHYDCLSNLELPEEKIQKMLGIIEKDMVDIVDLLRAVTLMRHQNDKLQELVSGYGEIWSAQMIQCYFEHQGLKCRFLNARDVLIVEEAPGGVNTTAPGVYWEESRGNMKVFVDALDEDEHLVITGFVATTNLGVATTLKRDGSDYSASIFGNLLSSTSITIWTDVDGVMSADPRRVPEAKVLAEVSYDEAMELAYFGAKVIHPKTMAPAVKAEIPIWIRNSFNPTYRGTRISRPSPFHDRQNCVAGFSTVDGVAAINVEGTGMVGVPGVANKLFGALHEKQINVNLIAQASSEHSICFVCKASDAATAKECIEEAFSTQLKLGLISKVDVTQPCSIIAIVGDAMSRTPGVAGRFFSALGNAKINVVAISQGSSERNISAVVDARQSAKALRAAHAEFLHTLQVMNVGVVGTGESPCSPGADTIDMLMDQATVLAQRYNLKLHIRGIATISKMLLSTGEGIFAPWREKLEGSTVATDLTSFVEHIQSEFVPHTLIIDCTKSADVAKLHVDWLAQGIHVLTANNLGISSSLTNYFAIWRQRAETGANYSYEVTVGGSLPIIGTLHTIHSSGDVVRKLEASVSATLTNVMSLVSPLHGEPIRFSEAVQKTFETGVCERNPLEDLAGVDASRKLLILARDLGLEIELAQIHTEAIVPVNLPIDLANVQVALQDYDARIQKRVEEANQKGAVLRYVSRITEEATASCQLEEIDREHPIARLKGTSFLVAFHTDRFNDQPLIIQGPAATGCTGIFNDLIRISRDIGARDKGNISQQNVQLLSKSRVISREH